MVVNWHQVLKNQKIKAMLLQVQKLDIPLSVSNKLFGELGLWT